MLRIFLMIVFLSPSQSIFAMDNIEADAAYEKQIKEQIRVEFIQGLTMLKEQASRLGMEVRERDISTLQQHMYEKAIMMARCVDKAVTIQKSGRTKIVMDKYMTRCAETHLKFMTSSDVSTSEKCTSAGRRYGTDATGFANDGTAINPPYDFLGIKKSIIPPPVTDYVTIKDCLDSRSEYEKMLDNRR